MNKVIVTGIIFLSILTNLVNASITWSALGTGLNGSVLTVAISNGNVYAGGSFTTAGGVSTSNIAKWNGTNWSALGDGVNNTVWAIAVSGDDVYAGGQFTTAGGSNANYIAKWNGTAWSTLGTGVNNSVRAIALMGADVYAGGEFTTAGGNSALAIAKWDGSNWSALGSSVGASVYCIAVSSPNIYVGGAFTTAGGISANRIAKWNTGTSSWSALGDGLTESVNTIAISGSNIFAGGHFTHSGVTTANYIAKWDGSSWSAVGNGVGDDVRAITVFGSDVYVGGYFITAGGSGANRIAKWDGSNWSALGSGVNSTVWGLAINTSEGKMYVGGDFTDAGGNGNGDYIASFTDSDNSLPVTLSNFSAKVISSGVVLGWSTESETENLGFIIEKRLQVTGDRLQVADYTTDEALQGHGSTSEAHEYLYTDAAVVPGNNYFYRLADVDYSGKVNWHKEVEVKVEAGEPQVPLMFGLQPAYPNPFNPSVTLSYTLTDDGHTNLKAYNLRGELVKVLISTYALKGTYSLTWRPQNLGSGVYILYLQSGSRINYQKVVFIK